MINLYCPGTGQNCTDSTCVGSRCNIVHGRQASHIKPDPTLEKLKRELYEITDLKLASSITAEAIDAFVRARFDEFKKELASILFPETQR